MKSTLDRFSFASFLRCTSSSAGMSHREIALSPLIGRSGTHASRTKALTYILAASALTSPVAALAQNDAPSDRSEAPAQPVAESPVETQDAAGNSSIVVTGSRLTNTNFIAPTPVTVIGSEMVVQQAPANIQEIIAKLPAFRSTVGTQNGGLSANTFLGVQGLPDLRGLGSSRTLVLMDGQRFVGGNVYGLPDTNMFPVNLIDRVEVVTGGASASYGSDAVAGVVNFIMRDRMEGVTAQVLKGSSTYGDAEETTASLAFGINSGDDRLHLVGAVDYAKNEGAKYTDRDWSNGIFLVPTTAGRAADVPANLFASDTYYTTILPQGIVASGVLKGRYVDAAGVLQTQHCASVYGSLGLGCDVGTYPRENLYVANPYNRTAAHGRLTYDLGSDTKLWLQGNYGRTSTRSFGSDPQASLTIRRDNPFLPASLAAAMDANGLGSVLIGALLPELLTVGETTRQSTTTYRAAAGASTEIFGDWTADTSVETGRTRQTYIAPATYLIGNLAAASYAVRDANGNIVCGALVTNPNLTPARAAEVLAGCVPYNIFASANSPEALAYINGSHPSFEAIIKQTAGAINFNGTLFEGWAGPVSLAFGAEFRHDSLDVAGDALSSASTYNTLNQNSYSGTDTVYEGYGEIGIPLLKGLPLIDALDFTAGLRRTHYRTSGGVTTWKLGLSYDVTDWLRLRATRSRDIRAPSLYELNLRGATSLTNITNSFFSTTHPGTVGPNGNVATMASGNADLVPEVANNFVIGAVLLPHWVRGLRASVDYSDTKIADVISLVGQQESIDRCFAGQTEYCSGITFDPTTPTGISQIFSSRQNQAQLRSRTLNIEVSYVFPGSLPFGLDGQLSARMLATRTFELSVTTAAGVTTNFAGTGGTASLDFSGGAPLWTGNFSLNYTSSRFSTGVNMRAFSSMIYDLRLIGPDDPAYAPSSASSINQNNFPGSAYVDWNGRITVLENGFAGSSVELFSAITNVFNRRPPLYGTIAFAQRSALYDTVGRTFRIGARVKF